MTQFFFAALLLVMVSRGGVVAFAVAMLAVAVLVQRLHSRMRRALRSARERNRSALACRLGEHGLTGGLPGLPSKIVASIALSQALASSCSLALCCRLAQWPEIAASPVELKRVAAILDLLRNVPLGSPRRLRADPKSIQVQVLGGTAQAVRKGSTPGALCMSCPCAHAATVALSNLWCTQGCGRGFMYWCPPSDVNNPLSKPTILVTFVHQPAVGVKALLDSRVTPLDPALYGVYRGRGKVPVTAHRGFVQANAYVHESLRRMPLHGYLCAC
jgi:hypothetical protein